MALIRCPECGRGVSDTATACPGCTCPIGPTAEIKALHPSHPIAFLPPQDKSPPYLLPSDTAKLRKTFSAKRWIPPTIAALLLIAGLFSANFDWRVFDRPKYSDAQREAAQGFWDTVVDQYLKLGLITHYRTEGPNFIIYVRETQWRLLSYEDKRTFLSNVSRTNEILGRTSRVEIRDNDTGRSLWGSDFIANQ